MTGQAINLEEKLNQEQYAAATYIAGHSLIIAGAGSGKTRTLTYKIAHLIDQGIAPQNILAVTFTNKAANEMKERLLSILEESGNNAYHRSSTKRIGTFHSTFLKILKQDIDKLEAGYNTSFSVYDSADSMQLTKTVIKDLNMKDQIDHKEARRVISQWKNAGRLPAQAGNYCDSQLEERILKIYQRYQQQLQTANALDFDDLLLLTKQLFVEQPDILQKRQSQFTHILVDEAQDTNAIQFELIRLLVGERAIVTLIGDDYQSIYRRRGAKMENFLNVEQLWPTIKMFKLETNYRSLPHIVAAGNSIIQNNKKQYDKQLRAHRSGEQHIRIFEFADEIDEAAQIVELITKLKEEQNRSRNDFTILYRTNAQSSPFEQILLTEGIPYQIIGAFKFFERKEIKDMISYLKVLYNHNDDISLKRIINTPPRRIGDATIEEISLLAQDLGSSLGSLLIDNPQLSSQLTDGTYKKILPFVQLLQASAQKLDESNPGAILDFIAKTIGYETHIKKTDGAEQAEERMQNIGQLINMASSFEETGMAGLTRFLEEISLLTSLEELQTGEVEALKLMTVHGSKGLEFPYVFIVGLEENILPLAKAKFDPEELEEERRGMYVAITRAENQLFLSYAKSRRQRGQIKYNQPSRFLDELPQELCKIYNMSQVTTKQSQPEIDEGDVVKHKLFGSGVVLEVRSNVAIVKFDNPKFNIRKLEHRFLQRV